MFRYLDALNIKVKVEVYGLVPVTKRHSPDYAQLPTVYSMIDKPPHLPGEHNAWLPFWGHNTDHIHKPSVLAGINLFLGRKSVHNIYSALPKGTTP